MKWHRRKDWLILRDEHGNIVSKRKLKMNADGSWELL